MTDAPEVNSEGRSAGPGELRRDLGIFGAAMMGLGSIVGTGVFVSIGVAAEVAGPSALLAIAAAAGVAVCNGLSSAQLAANHPVSGGTYEYGRRRLRPFWGFLAGWLFLCAKSASAATAALGFSGYLLRMVRPEGSGLLVPVALTALVPLTAVTLRGIRRSSAANVAIVTVTLLSLIAFCVVGVSVAVENAGANLTPFFGRGAVGFLEATALMFVAYTGYGRIATLGEEVRDPRKTIPRAVIVTLTVSMLLYLSVAFTAIGAVGPDAYGQATRENAAPLEIVAGGFGIPGLNLFLAVGAMTAMLGVLLNLILGLSRVLFAMGRNADAPAFLGAVDPVSAVPKAATVAVVLLVAGLTLIGDVRLTWSFSAFTVLLYYALTNLCALRLRKEERLFPIWTACVGLSSCVFLACWVDRTAWLAGAALLAVGAAWYALFWTIRRAR